MRTVGRYRILELLASGGMADVYRAEVVGAAGVRKEVALKLVRGDRVASPGLADRFVREARLAARLSHANIVQIFEFDEVEGRHFIAMELVRGHHLGRVVERCRELGLRFGVPRALFVAAEVATALAYAHQPGEDGAPGLVHRDVSPHNVLVSWEGEVKLADFGIARAASGGLTVPGTLEGKLAWVAPEQARGEPADARADLFSLGVILWELLTGARLFARETEAATLEALLHGPAPSPPSTWNEEIPPELDALVARCLERDPSRRTASARDLADELRALLLRDARSPRDWELRGLMQRLWPDGRAVPAAPAEETLRRPPEGAEPPAPVAAEPSEVETRTLVAGPLRPGGRRRPALVMAGVAAAAALAAAAWRGARSGPARSAPPMTGASAERAASDVPRQAAPAPAEARAPAGEGTGAPPVEAPAAPGRSNPDLGRAAPPRESGEGLLSVNATPWAALVVDGRRVGDTPRELRLPAGRHRVRVDHPRLGAVEATVVIVAGQRTGWYPRLKR